MVSVLSPIIGKGGPGDIENILRQLSVGKMKRITKW
jgi:hypothetical protein